MTKQNAQTQQEQRETVFLKRGSIKAIVLEKVSDTETKVTFFSPYNDRKRMIEVVPNDVIEPFDVNKHPELIRKRKVRIAKQKEQRKEQLIQSVIKVDPNETYNMVRDFHKAFNHLIAESPTPIPESVALPRAVWTGEELVEFLYATVAGDMNEFDRVYDLFKQGLDKAANKIRTNKPVIDDVLVAQADALTDVEYFNQGSFVVMGVEPFNLFKIVQGANMGKLFEDGKPRFREEDGKIIKPPHWETECAPEPKLKAEIARQIQQTSQNK